MYSTRLLAENGGNNGRSKTIPYEGERFDDRSNNKDRVGYLLTPLLGCLLLDLQILFSFL